MRTRRNNLPNGRRPTLRGSASSSSSCPKSLPPQELPSNGSQANVSTQSTPADETLPKPNPSSSNGFQSIAPPPTLGSVVPDTQLSSNQASNGLGPTNPKQSEGGDENGGTMDTNYPLTQYPSLEVPGLPNTLLEEVRAIGMQHGGTNDEDASSVDDDFENPRSNNRCENNRQDDHRRSDQESDSQHSLESDNYRIFRSNKKQHDNSNHVNGRQANGRQDEHRHGNQGADIFNLLSDDDDALIRRGNNHYYGNNSCGSSNHRGSGK